MTIPSSREVMWWEFDSVEVKQPDGTYIFYRVFYWVDEFHAGHGLAEAQSRCALDPDHEKAN